MSSLGKELRSLVLGVLCLSLFYSAACQGVQEVKGYPPSVNCKTQECVQYEVVHSQKEFEVRIYENSVWVSSGYIATVSYNVGYNAGYIDAYKFYKGRNTEGLTLNKYTQPVLTDIIPNTYYDSIYRVYILVPKANQNHIPAPYKGQDVTPVTLPPKKFAVVKRFSGYLTDKIIAAELAALKSSLKGTPWAIAAASPNCTIADYQFILPFQKDGRVNEVILWVDKN